MFRSSACVVAGVRFVTQLCVSRNCTHTFRPSHPSAGSLSLVNSRIHRSYEFKRALASRGLSQSPYGSTTPNTSFSERNEEREHTGDNSLRYVRQRKFDLWKVKQKRFTRHITNLIRKGKVEEAENVFQDMLSAKVRPSTAVFNNLIAGYSRIGDARKAFKYFNNLKKRGLLPTDHTYASVFRACAEMGPSSLPLLEKIISEIDRRDILLNTIATNSLIIAMATCGLFDEAFQLYFDMSKRRQKPDITTFTALLSVCARDGERGLEKVPHVWQEMTACGVGPDLVSYNTLLKGLKEAGIPDDMKHHEDIEVIIPAIDTRELHSISSRAGFKLPSPAPDEKCRSSRSGVRSGIFRVTSKTQVNLHLTAAPLTLHLTSSGWRWLDPASVEKLLSLLNNSGLQPDIHTLNYLSQMASDWTTVLRDVGVVNGKEGVVSRPVIPDKWCLISATRLQAQLGNHNAAQAIRVFGEEAGLLHGSAGYQAVAGGCLSLQQGLSLLKQMKEAGLVPDQHVMGTLFGNAASKRNYEYLVALMKEMRYCKIEPNSVIAQILEKVAESKIPQSPRMKLRHNGFKGYYYIWKKHYPQKFG